MPVMNDDYLLQQLKALCKRFAADPVDGRFSVANTAHVSEQYLYQLLTSKPMANGRPRSVGSRLRKALTSAYPDWLDQPASASASTVRRIPPAERQEIMELLAAARRLNTRGVDQLIGMATQMAKTHPLDDEGRGAAKAS